LTRLGIEPQPPSPQSGAITIRLWRPHEIFLSLVIFSSSNNHLETIFHLLSINEYVLKLQKANNIYLHFDVLSCYTLAILAFPLTIGIFEKE